ncbi:MAG: tRNA (adenosine(37)-N6)-threonylcarbamoyltransferase complex ATPase subunit type 1 TsaE [Actinomycetota bacterium]|nr:tRNA (adenosine(37)-N6)-threonylcarbamoyltransferase complex ATPase subunit type 1 TsaE [Actinomycetota bacterium]
MSVIRTSSAADTEKAGAKLAAQLAPGDLVLIAGELGAGKTTFVRGGCRALGVSEPVVSPTFTIGRRYRGENGRLISHLDLYRLADMASEEEGLLDDYLSPDGIAFVEWPAVAEPDLPDAAVRVEIRHAGRDERELTIEWIREQGRP